MPQNVLIVCVGNICRSPIAEAVMRDKIARAGLQEDWYVESAAIEGWHCGSRPDERALRVLDEHNIECSSVARQLQPEDFQRFDYILAMDRSNLASLKHLAPKGGRAKLLLLGDFGLKPDERSIEDPYYLMGLAPFKKIYEQCTIACEKFLKQAQMNEIW
ncbi:low molecular weight phosphotyrosine protein phosphatase 2 [Drosophila guanche]|uniref:Low molecular weight phosphotyrosine protein phosphatase n=2 Tax=Drosophila guanche TaxID=7266 RepID=A0A3B0JIZ6_DROGU|nr:low molecular weight phosphotyrosine protein phosphatase 2 [Drosophila guanche]SPP80302.1 blast:Low molecular weight phosphotyrosine protein phosphatase 2 [Drosophila guanche]